MKKTLQFALVAALAIGTVACGSEQSEDQTQSQQTGQPEVEAQTTMDKKGMDQPAYKVPELPNSYVALDLAEFGLAAKITGPEGTQANATKRYTTEGETTQIGVLLGGEQTSLQIFKREIDLMQVKREVENNSISAFQRYLAEDAEGVIFESKMSGNQGIDYNFVVMKTIGGEQYHITGAGPMGNPLLQEQAALLYAVAKSLQ